MEMIKMEYRNYKESKLFNLSSEDSNRLRYIYKNYENNNILENCDILEYEVTGRLIEELVAVERFEIRELGSTTIRFYTDSPDEIFSKALQEKFEKFKEKDVPLEYTLIALAYSARQKPKIKQERKGLTLKRVKLPKSIATLVQHSNLINCKNKKEIQEFQISKKIFKNY